MKIKSINIEGMHRLSNKTYTFNDLNYLVGENGAGKSTVLEAIQLALLGYVPGNSKKNEGIFLHANGSAMSVTLLLDDNGSEVSIRRSWMNTGKSITSAVVMKPENYDIVSVLKDIEVPIYNFREFTTMSSNQLKSWFIDFLPSATGEIDWEEELTKVLGDKQIIDDTLQTSTIATINELSNQYSGVELVKQVNTNMKDSLSFQKGQLSSMQATVNSLIKYDDCDDNIDIEQAERTINELTQMRMDIAKYNQQVANNERILAALAELKTSAATYREDKEYIKLAAESAKLDKAVAKASEKRQNDANKIAEYKSAIAEKRGMVKGTGTCPYTHQTCETASNMVNEINEQIAELTDKMNAAASAYNVSNAEVVDLSNQKSQIIQASQKIISTYTNKDSLSHQIQDVVAIPDVSDDELQTRIANLNDSIIKAQANKKYYDLTDKLTADKFKLENTIEVLKIWIKLTDANNLQTQLMTKPFENLESDMNAYIQKLFNDADVTAKFNMSEKANSFSFGINRDSKYIPFEVLSSGEQCLYTLALMMCITDKAKSPLKVILIDDLLDHLDDSNAKSLFESLYTIEDIQFILAGVKKCEADIAENITIEV